MIRFYTEDIEINLRLKDRIGGNEKLRKELDMLIETERQMIQHHLENLERYRLKREEAIKRE